MTFTSKIEVVSGLQNLSFYFRNLNFLLRNDSIYVSILTIFLTYLIATLIPNSYSIIGIF